ncbi:hypothetical protein [Streptomyces sp. NPDC089919]|uniref:hypothetical protein n=1 Tax=Streptomyces sp. NPDC089919 TaxID=3155188 RepID=UPI00342FE398
MFVFVCAGCGTDLTAPLSRVELPAHAHQKYGNGLQLPVLMEPGTFAVDPEPWGPPWRRWEEIDPAEAEARGVYAPVFHLSDGLPGAVVIAPGDVRGTRLIPDRADGYCCGLDGADGPNLACEGCGLPVASRIDDCSLWQAVWLAPDAVRRVPVGGADPVPLSWAEVLDEGKDLAPFEPVAMWGARRGVEHFWSWSPRWEPAAGRALAHLLAASEGRPVAVPDGLSGQVFQRALDAMLPAGAPPLRAVPAGPGRPVPAAGADILLVPTHPQTGEMWRPEGAGGAAPRVPLPFGMWLRLAFPRSHLPVPASGGLPAGVLRDDPPAPRPGRFRADENAFQRTLVRLPVVRSPWVREALDRLARRPPGSIF